MEVGGGLEGRARQVFGKWGADACSLTLHALLCHTYHTVVLWSLTHEVEDLQCRGL